MKTQTVIITGAAGGIGSEVARCFADKYPHYDLVLVDHPSAKHALEVLEKEIVRTTSSTFGQNIFLKLLDVTCLQDVCHMVDEITHENEVRVLVNAAGIMPRAAMKTLAKMEEKDLAAMRHVMDVNFWGTLHCCRAILPHMREAKYGRIVNFASVVGMKGDAGNLAYAASKAAVISLTKTLACEAPFNKNRDEPTLDITVNAVAPGIVETPMTTDLSDAALAPYMIRNPQQRKLHPSEIAQAVLWLASKEASGVNGTCLPVDGGYLVS